MNRAYSVTDWQRDFAKAFAAAVPLESMHTQARGALLAAQNDEPEPRSQHPVIQAGEADARKALRHEMERGQPLRIPRWDLSDADDFVF